MKLKQHSYSAQPVPKIRGTAAVMGKGHHFQAIRQSDKDHVIRKIVNRHLADAVIGHTRYLASYLRKGFDQAKCSSRFRSKPFGDTRIAIAVPT